MAKEKNKIFIFIWVVSDMALNAWVKYFSFNIPLIYHIRFQTRIMTAALSNLKKIFMKI